MAQITVLNFEDDLFAVIGLDDSDLEFLKEAGGFDPIDLTKLFEHGMPLPSKIQIVYGETQAAIQERIRESLPEEARDAPTKQIWGDETDG